MRQALWLDRSYVETEIRRMRQAGMASGDSLWAAAAGNCLLVLDRACMSGAPAVPVEYTLRPHNLIIAQCYPPAAKQERYEIFVVGFQARMEAECSEHQLTHNGMWDMFGACVALAAHEVRHRVQQRMPQVRRFTPFGKSGPEMFLRARVSVLSERFREKREELRTTPKGCILADKFYNDNEFDAQIVEHVVRRKGPHCKTMVDLAKLVLFEPTL